MLKILLILTCSVFANSEYKRTYYLSSNWTDKDNDCQNTRAEVLIRESIIPVKFRGGDSCVVDSGMWIDSYTGKKYQAAINIDIDHLVPLKEAHESGASSWTSAQKKTFANDLKDTTILVVTHATVNRSKGSKSPDKWLPPNKALRQQYCLQWATIKAQRNLTVTRSELKALKLYLADHPVLNLLKVRD
jgi:hypothetical protein